MDDYRRVNFRDLSIFSVYMYIYFVFFICIYILHVYFTTCQHDYFAGFWTESVIGKVLQVNNSPIKYMEFYKIKSEYLFSELKL